MTSADFLAKHGRIPRYLPPGAPGWLEFIDAEIAQMRADLPPIGTWSAVPDGASVFIRWNGGNRGVYRVLGDSLTIAGDPTWREPLPEIGVERWHSCAWMVDASDAALTPPG